MFVHAFVFNICAVSAWLFFGRFLRMCWSCFFSWLGQLFKYILYDSCRLT